MSKDNRHVYVANALLNSVQVVDLQEHKLARTIELGGPETPSPAKRRTASVTTELAGHTIQPGEKVLFWEGSANRDERAFVEAMLERIPAAPRSNVVGQPEQQRTRHEHYENQIISGSQGVERIAQRIASFEVDPNEVDDD